MMTEQVIPKSFGLRATFRMAHLGVAALCLCTLATPAYAQPEDVPADATLHEAAPEAALEAAIAQSHVALEAILNGDPSGYETLFADRDDITLGNPFGPFGKGRAAVMATLANAATKYESGSVVGVERLALYRSGSIAALVEIEHDRAKVTGADKPADFFVRVTSVYEQGGGAWKLVHRHADPITTARTAQSVFGLGRQPDTSQENLDACRTQRPRPCSLPHTPL